MTRTAATTPRTAAARPPAARCPISSSFPEARRLPSTPVDGRRGRRTHVKRSRVESATTHGGHIAAARAALVIVSDVSEPAAAGGLDPDHVARAHVAGHLR